MTETKKSEGRGGWAGRCVQSEGDSVDNKDGKGELVCWAKR